MPNRPLYEDSLEKAAQHLLNDKELALKQCTCKWCNYRGYVISNIFIYEEYCPNCGLDGYGSPGDPE